MASERLVLWRGPSATLRSKAGYGEIGGGFGGNPDALALEIEVEDSGGCLLFGCVSGPRYHT